MRLLILISALMLVSLFAQAGESDGFALAADTTTATAAGSIPQPLPPVAKSDSSRTDASKVEASRIETSKPQASQPAAPSPRVSRSRATISRYGSDEARARRIAARYGISW